MKGNVIELDRNALRDAITERGKNLSQASRDLGYSDAYISYCISTGQMKESAAKLLCYQLNIPPLPDQEEAGSNASECRQRIIHCPDRCLRREKPQYVSLLRRRENLRGIQQDQGPWQTRPDASHQLCRPHDV